MGEWKVTPMEGVVDIDQENGKITFSKNTGTSDKSYKIYYIDDNGCKSNEKQYTLPVCLCKFNLKTDNKGAVVSLKNEDGSRTYSTFNMGDETETSVTISNVDKVYAYVSYSNSCIIVDNNPVEISCGETGESESHFCCVNPFITSYEIIGLNEVPKVGDTYLPITAELYISHTRINSCSTNVKHSTPSIKLFNVDSLTSSIFSYRINENTSSICNDPQYNKTGGYNFTERSPILNINNNNGNSSSIQDKAHYDAETEKYTIGELSIRQGQFPPNSVCGVSKFSYGFSTTSDPTELRYTVNFVEDGEQPETDGSTIHRTYKSDAAISTNNDYLKLTLDITVDPSINSLKYKLKFENIDKLKTN